MGVERKNTARVVKVLNLEKKENVKKGIIQLYVSLQHTSIIPSLGLQYFSHYLIQPVMAPTSPP